MSTCLPLLATASLLAGLTSGTAGDPAPDVAHHPAVSGAQEQRRVLDYWTPQRMARAVPADPPATAGRPPAVVRLSAPAWHGVVFPAARGVLHQGVSARSTGARWAARGAVTQTTGRVFLSMGGRDFFCSASAVRSGNRDLVVTAGHCVKDGPGAWADNWTFVPGYRDGHRPHGSFTARRMFVTGPWARTGDDSYDVGMVALNTSGGRHLTDVVGAQEISFDAPRGQHAWGFGFPADPPYTGRHLMYCAGPLLPDPHGQTRDQGMRCDLTAGSSGGPWLTGFDSRTGRGTIISVASFKYSNDHRTMYGPYFDAKVKELYTVAERA